MASGSPFVAPVDHRAHGICTATGTPGFLGCMCERRSCRYEDETHAPVYESIRPCNCEEAARRSRWTPCMQGQFGMRLRFCMQACSDGALPEGQPSCGRSSARRKRLQKGSRRDANGGLLPTFSPDNYTFVYCTLENLCPRIPTLLTTTSGYICSPHCRQRRAEHPRGNDRLESLTNQFSRQLVKRFSINSCRVI